MVIHPIIGHSEPNKSFSFSELKFSNVKYYKVLLDQKHCSALITLILRPFEVRQISIWLNSPEMQLVRDSDSHDSLPFQVN